MTVAVQLRQYFRSNARFAVKIIGVLRNQKLKFPKFLEFDQSKMRFVGLNLSRRNAPFRRRQTCIAARPDAIRSAKIGNARIRADSGAGKSDNVFGFDDPLSDCFNLLRERLFVFHLNKACRLLLFGFKVI